MSTELKGIAAELLIMDANVQARAGQDPQQIARLRMSDPQDWPPLLVTPNPDPEKPGTYLVIDGAHRFLAGQRLEDGKRITVYPCKVREDLDYEHSCQANLAHKALPLSTSDRKGYAHFLHQHNPQLSDRAIGRQVGLHHTTVANHLARVSRLPTVKPRQEIPRLLRLLVSILKSGEGAGFLGLGNRPSAVATAILASRDPEVVIRSVKAWIPILEQAVDIAEANTG